MCVDKGIDAQHYYTILGCCHVVLQVYNSAQHCSRNDQLVLCSQVKPYTP